MVRFVCISDTHNKHNQLEELPQGDVLLHAGDLSGLGRTNELKSFAKWWEKQPFEYKVLIAGNHDLMFEDDPDRAIGFFDGIPNSFYLNQSEVVIEGIKIWGEPRTPAFGHGWAFNVPRNQMADECWSKVPEDTDILLTHGPPHGCGDLVEDVHGCGDWSSGRLIRVGCTAQRELISKLGNLKHVVCGHIHEGYGQYGLSGTEIHNVTQLNLRYQPIHQPICFEV